MTNVFGLLSKTLHPDGIRATTLKSRDDADWRDHPDGEWAYCDQCWWQHDDSYNLCRPVDTSCECGAPLLVLHDLRHYEMKELEGGASMAFIVARRLMLKSSSPTA